MSQTSFRRGRVPICESDKFRIKVYGLIGNFSLAGFWKIIYQPFAMFAYCVAISAFIFSKAVRYRDVLKCTILK